MNAERLYKTDEFQNRMLLKLFCIVLFWKEHKVHDGGRAVKTRWTVLTTLCCILLVPLVLAQRDMLIEQTPETQANEKQGKRWALLIGIDQYDSEAISPLRYCVADVSAFNELLIDPATGAFDPNQVYLMTNKDKGTDRPTNTNVIFRLEKMVELVKPEDTFLFYFAGHGMTRDGKPFLLSVNSDARTLSTLKISAIPLEEVKQVLSSIKAHQTLFILDACRNDPSSGRGDEDNPLTETFARNFQVIPGLETSGLPAVTATLYACSVGERAYEWPEKQHGVFSYYLLEGFNGKAASPDGEITVTSLAKYTQQQVSQWAKGNLSEGKTQTPWLVHEGGAEMVIAQVQTQIEDTQRPQIKIVEPVGVSPRQPYTVESAYHGNLVQPLRLVGIASDNVGVHSVRVNGLLMPTETVPAHSLKMVELPKTQKASRFETTITLSLAQLQEVEIHATDTTGNVEVQHFQLRLLLRFPTIVGKDGAEMVLIPAGEFQMGSNDGLNDEKPVHRVYLDAFYMDKYEVTNAQFKKFIDANPAWAKDRIPSQYHIFDRDFKYHDGDYLKDWNGDSYPSGKGNHPVVWVSWHTAAAYAQWAGKRLPTEAEWEKAARGGMEGKKYPWGDSIDSTKANYGATEGEGGTKPVGSYSPNSYGLYDMMGNVWEWCMDAWDSGFYARSPITNPVAGGLISFVNNGFRAVYGTRVIRGGSWGSSPGALRVASRGDGAPDGTGDHLGFRCAVRPSELSSNGD